MDVYRFINSKDVSKHLHDIGHEFTAIEAAYLVEICEDATLSERIDAWQAITETMPDCHMAWNHNVEKRDSTRDFLREYIDLQQRMLSMFKENAGCIYYLRECRYAEWPDWLARKDENLWIEEVVQPFSTFEGCVNHLKAELKDDGDEFDRYVIGKAKIDCIGEPYDCLQDEIVLDAQFNPLDISIGGLTKHDRELANHLRYSFLKLPVPFKRGDIVIDRTDRNPHPFVFDRLKFWNSKELVEHGHEALSPDEAKRLDARTARCDERCSWDDSYMVACGYELGVHYSCSSLHDPCDLCFDVFGASCNYLNLEHYAGPLDGGLKVLEIMSEFVKDEIDIECLVNFTRLAALAQHASSLELSYDTEYTPAVRHLYQGAKR